MNITTLTKTDQPAWDAYVLSRPDANVYHLSGWKAVVEKTYGHKSYYLMATTTQSSVTSPQTSVTGILPLVHMRHFIFGNKLVSIPFFDMGGILADNQETEQALLSEAITLGKKLDVETIELRHTQPLAWLEGKQKGSRIQGFKGSRRTNVKKEDSRGQGVEGSRRTNTKKEDSRGQGFKDSSGKNQTNSKFKIQNSKLRGLSATHKVRMLLDLPASSDELMKSFKAKLRSQIKRPMKEGLVATIGGLELMDHFYSVFCVNMRDLGSPVHSRKMLETVLAVFADTARMVIVFKGDTPVACGLVVGFQDTLENPWASSLREFSRLSPNMLLYWTMLAYACDNGYRKFDFGRSTPGEGTFKFKQQWGAEPQPLHWHTLSLHGQPEIDNDLPEKSKFNKAIQYWQKLPVPATRFLGPMIRKHIAL